MSNIVKSIFIEKKCAKDFLNDNMSNQNSKCYEYLHKLIDLNPQHCAFCLGAGVSIKIGQPSWSDLLNTLMQGVFIHVLSSERNNGIKQLYTTQEILDVMKGKRLFSSVGTLETAEYIQMFLSTKSMNDCKVDCLDTNSLHLDKTYMASDVRAALELNKVKSKSVPKDWELLYALADLVIKKSGIKQIITYNYDDALEFAIQKRLAKRKKVSINVHSYGLRDCIVRLSEKNMDVHIYHVHGKLSIYTGTQSDIEKEIDDGVVLSERSYIDIEYGAYGPTNVCQAHIFQAHSCIFVGFSAQDYNYRRIVRGVPIGIDVIKETEKRINSLQVNLKERQPHFIFYPIDSLIDEIYGKPEIDNTMNPNYEGICKVILQNMIKLHSDYYTRHNVWPIYVTYSELPKIIKGLNKR